MAACLRAYITYIMKSPVLSDCLLFLPAKPTLSTYLSMWCKSERLSVLASGEVLSQPDHHPPQPWDDRRFCYLLAHALRRRQVLWACLLIPHLPYSSCRRSSHAIVGQCLMHVTRLVSSHSQRPPPTLTCPRFGFLWSLCCCAGRAVSALFSTPILLVYNVCFWAQIRATGGIVSDGGVFGAAPTLPGIRASAVTASDTCSQFLPSAFLPLQLSPLL